MWALYFQLNYYNELMKKLCTYFLLSISFCSVAQGSNIDIENFSCKQYLATINILMKSEQKHAATTFMSWLYGYIVAKKNSSIYDAQELSSIFTIFNDECKNNPKTEVVRAIHNSWDKYHNKK